LDNPLTWPNTLHAALRLAGFVFNSWGAQQQHDLKRWLLAELCFSAACRNNSSWQTRSATDPQLAQRK
jgi:hypothetical protein